MDAKLLGIHHVTAIAGDPQKNVDFYVRVLGLRLVKKTVNFDDPYTYHLYYGDEVGSPGTILTFFPLSSKAGRGRRGVGQLTVFSFSVPASAISFWMDRLKSLNIEFQKPFSRFDEEVLALKDPDGFEVELVGTASDARMPWKAGPIPPEFAIRGFAGVTLSEENSEETSEFMTSTLGFQLVTEAGNRFRLAAGTSDMGSLVDISLSSGMERGIMGVGAVHHVAWRTPNDDQQLAFRYRILEAGYDVTPVIDRRYFHSIYFREPGRALFEIATDPPGFSIDESKEMLGTSLMLPPWLEQFRLSIEENLPSIKVPSENSSNPKT